MKLLQLPNPGEGGRFNKYYGFGPRPLLISLRNDRLSPNINQVSEIIANRAFNKIVNKIVIADCRPTSFDALKELESKQ
jgi:hypothetical protein